MSEREIKNYIFLAHRGPKKLFNTGAAYIDLENYQADDIFVRNELEVKFMEEYSHPTYEGYRLIMVSFKKKDEDRFKKCMEELKTRMTVLDRSSDLGEKYKEIYTNWIGFIIETAEKDGFKIND